MSAETLPQLLARALKVPAKNFNANEAKLAEKILSGLGALPSIVAAGSFTTAGGDANESITVSGALVTDIAIVVVHTVGASPRTILTSKAAANAINLVFSGDPSTDHIVKYVLLRLPA